MICPSVQDLSPTLHVASLANERVLRGCQEPIGENNKIEHVTKIGCAMVNMDKCAQSTPAAATEAQQQTHKTCIADVTDMCNWIDTSSREVSSRSLLTGMSNQLGEHARVMSSITVPQAQMVTVQAKIQLTRAGIMRDARAASPSHRRENGSIRGVPH